MARSRNNRCKSSNHNQSVLTRTESTRQYDENNENKDDDDDDDEEVNKPDGFDETVHGGRERSDDDDDEDEDNEDKDNDGPQFRPQKKLHKSIDPNTAIRIQQMQEEIKMLQETNLKMKRIIKKKKYDEAEGEFVVRKLVAMQRSTLIKYVKNVIFPHVKSACNELLFNKPAIIEKCFHHLGIKSTSDQQALRDDVCQHVKYSLCQKRKYVKERLRMAFNGEFVLCFSLHVMKIVLLTTW